MSRKTGLILAATPALLAAVLCAFMLAGFMLIRSGTDIAEEVASPDGAWLEMLMVRNLGATTDYSAQISLVPARRPLSRFLATGRPGNLFIADGNDGAVLVNGQGLMDVELRWESPSDLLIYFPSNSRVYKQQSKVQSVAIKYVAYPW
jgi:hypothetical protein